MLLVARLDIIGLWKDPDLKEVGLHIGRIEFRVQDAGASRHTLDVTGRDRFDVTRRVLVG